MNVVPCVFSVPVTAIEGDSMSVEMSTITFSILTEEAVSFLVLLLVLIRKLAAVLKIKEVPHLKALI